MKLLSKQELLRQAEEFGKRHGEGKNRADSGTESQSVMKEWNQWRDFNSSDIREAGVSLAELNQAFKQGGESVPRRSNPGNISAGPWRAKSMDASIKSQAAALAAQGEELRQLYVMVKDLAQAVAGKAAPVYVGPYPDQSSAQKEADQRNSYDSGWMVKESDGKWYAFQDSKSLPSVPVPETIGHPGQKANIMKMDDGREFPALEGTRFGYEYTGIQCNC